MALMNEDEIKTLKKRAHDFIEAIETTEAEKKCKHDTMDSDSIDYAHIFFSDKDNEDIVSLCSQDYRDLGLQSDLDSDSFFNMNGTIQQPAETVPPPPRPAATIRLLQ